MSDANSPADDDISEDELDQIIQDIAKDDDAEKPAAAAATPSPAPSLSLVSGKKTKESAVKPEQALSLELTGVINLKLCFASGERSIEVLCTEEALVCRMADGTEFRIPTGITKKRQAA